MGGVLENGVKKSSTAYRMVLIEITGFPLQYLNVWSNRRFNKQNGDLTKRVFSLTYYCHIFPADGFLATEGNNGHQTNKICTTSSTHVLLIVFRFWSYNIILYYITFFYVCLIVASSANYSRERKHNILRLARGIIII